MFDCYLHKQQQATSHGIKLNLASISLPASPPPSAFSTTSSFNFSPSSLSFSHGRSFSNVSYGSSQEDSSFFSASSNISPNASLALPSINSTTPSRRELSPPSSLSSFYQLNFNGCEEYDPVRPYTNLIYRQLAKPFTPPTAKFNQLLNQFAEEQAPWAGVITTRLDCYPIHDVDISQKSFSPCIRTLDNTSINQRNSSKSEKESVGFTSE